MNVQDLGTYISGDTGTDTLISLVNDVGTVVDLTGATAIVLDAKSAQGDAFTVSGSIYGAATNGQVIFEDVAQGFTPTAARRRVAFSAVVKWTQASESWRSRDRVSFFIELFP